MNRTQIYLPHSQRMALKREAQTRNTTLSAIIRTILQDKLFNVVPKKKQPKNEGWVEAALRINKLGPKGPSDLSTNLDEYLYGGKK
ncbi:MAG: CopG family transcriptional regulator [Patescibacteria group bacterium]